MIRSADEWLMSRSCHNAVFSSAVTRLPRTTRARPHTRSVNTGFRLCGMVELRHPTRDLEPKSDRLGDDAVCPAGHQRPAVADRQVGRGLAQLRELVADELSRLDHLDGHRGVVQVLARHAEVDVTRLGLAD